jgi:hypothetical protein
MRSLVIASPHRYPDLARLWYRVVSERVAPAFERAGLHVDIVIFRDARPEHFLPENYPAAKLERPGPEARDFVEFYDAALGYPSDFVFFIDADVFVLDGPWAASWLSAFDDAKVAAVSFLRRAMLPGVYALLCKTDEYLQLPAPAFAARYEGLTRWPDSVNRGPGENAALALQRLGKTVVDANAAGQGRLSDFHGTTVIRASREMFAAEIGNEQFEALVSRKRYFLMGAYDNVLLGSLYERIFHEAFAPGQNGEPLAGSLTAEALRRMLSDLQTGALRERLVEYFAGSNRAILRLAAAEGLDYTFPAVLPPQWPQTIAA